MMNGLHCYTIIHDTSCHMDVGCRGANIKIKLQKKRLPSTVGICERTGSSKYTIFTNNPSLFSIYDPAPCGETPSRL